jgi:hypothetical protein
MVDTPEQWIAEAQRQRAAATGFALAERAGTPEQAAEALRLGADLGIHPGAVSLDPDLFRKRAEARRNTMILQDAPRTATWLRDQLNGTLAKDDLHTLTAFEKWGRGTQQQAYRNASGSTLGGIVRGVERGARRMPAGRDSILAFDDAALAADIGKTFDDIYREELARLAPGVPDAPDPMTGLNPMRVVEGTAMDNAMQRFGRVEALTPADRDVIVRRGAERLQKARERLAAIGDIPMSEGATAFRDGPLAGAENSLSGVLRAFAADPVGGAQFLIETAAEALPTLAGAAAVTALTRSPGAGAAAMGAGSFNVTASQTAMELLAERGADLSTPEAAMAVLQDADLMAEARRRGAAKGVVVAIFDAVSGGVAGKALSKSPLGDALLQGVAQGALGAGGEAAGQIAAAQDRQWADIVLEGLAEFVTAPVEAIGVGGRKLGKTLKKAAEAQTFSQRLAEIDALANASALKERSPEKFGDLLDAQGHGETYLHVEAEALREYFQAKDVTESEMLDAWGIEADAFEAAWQTGTRVAVPVSTYAARIVGTGDEAFFAQNASFDPEGLTAADAARVNEMIRDVLDEDARLQSEMQRAELERQSSDAQVFDDLNGQLRAAGQSPDVAKTNATMLTAFFRATAARVGEDPLDLFRSLMLRVRGPLADAGLGQPADASRLDDTSRAPDTTVLRERARAKAEAEIETAEAEMVKAHPHLRWKHPLANWIKGKGGIATKNKDGSPSWAAAELANRGVDIRRLPGLFNNRTGSQDLDNLWDENIAQVLGTDDTGGYLNREALIEALANELGGWGRTPLTLAAKTDLDRIEQMRKDSRSYEQSAPDLFGDPEDQSAAAKAARDKAEIDARQRQSKMGRLDQKRVEDDAGTLFGAGRQGTLFQGPRLNTDTEAFRRWFGDSKVVDAEGKPLVVYHGTRADFEAFGEDKVRSRFPFSDGFYFASAARASVYADSIANAAVNFRPDARFAKPVADGANVMPVYLSISNPKVLDAAIVGESAVDGPDAIAQAKADGHDGVIVRVNGEPDLYVAFRPEQIKSVFNSGSWSPTDPRILFQPAYHGSPLENGTVSWGALPNEWNDQAVVAKALVDRAGVLPEQLADVLEGVSGLTQSDRLGRLPSLAGMMAVMRAAGREEPQVLDAIVGLVPVDVVDMLFGSKGAANVALHDEAMLKDSPAFDADLSVSSLGDAAAPVRLLVVEAALRAAEVHLGSLEAGRKATEGDAAIGAGQGNTFRQGDRSKARASIAFPASLRSGQTIINLFEDNDLSSLLHESAHFFLEAYTALSSEAGAPADLIDDMATIREFLGNDGSPWTVEQHEKFARAGEAYFLEGKAPSLALADVFSRFKAWLTRIYRDMRGLNVKLNPEIRDVFDRMLATEAEIAAARDEAAMKPLFSEAPRGMADGDWATYQRIARRATEAAEQTLLERTMAKVRREREAWFREERKATRDEVAKEYANRREYQLIEAMTASDGPQIDRKMLEEQFGKGVTAEMTRQRLGGKRAIYGDGENTVTPQEAADLFGFANAVEMVEVLQNTGKFAEAVAAETDRRMDERHGDPLNDGSIEAEALEAVHNEQQAMTAMAEARHLAKLAGRSTRNMTATIWRARARAMLTAMTVRDVMNPGMFLDAERKAARAAEKAFAAVARGNAGKLPEAMQAKEQQVLNGFLYSEARVLEKKIGAFREKARDYAKAKVRQKIGEPYIDQIDVILEDFDFRVRSGRQIRRAESLTAFVDQMVAEGREGELAIDERLITDARKRHYTRLSVDEMRGVMDTVTNLDHLGRFKGKLIEKARMRDLEASAERLATAIRTNIGTGKAGQSNVVRSTFDLLFTADTMLVEMDGFKEMGAAYDEVKAGIDEAGAEEQRLQVELTKKLDALYAEHYTAKELAEFGKLKHVPGANGREWSKNEIMAVLLNMGNDGNKQRLFDPRVHEKNRLTPAQAQALIATLDERDVKFAQGMWDLINSYWPEIEAVAVRRTGVAPKKVEATPVETNHGTLRGGYYPAAYDPTLPSASGAAAKDAASAWDRFLSGGWGVRPAVASGMTVERVGSGGRTLKLDLSVAHFHIKDTIRLIALSEAVDATGRLLNHPLVTAAFLDAGRQNEKGVFDLWLKDIAAGPVRHADVLNRFSRMVKNNFTMMKLAFNFKTVALQVTGLAQSAAVIGKRNLLRGMLEYRKRPLELAAEVVAKSPFMAQRQTTFQKDINDFVSDVEMRTPIASRWLKGRDATAKAGFAPMTKVQFYSVDMPTWIGAYRAELARSKDEARALAYADRMVDRSQGGSMMADRNALSRGTLGQGIQQVDFIRLWTTLAGYMMTKMNRGYITARRGAKEAAAAETSIGKVAAVANMATDLTLLYVVEGGMIALLSALAFGDEDEDKEPQDYAAFIASQSALSLVGGIPVVRDLATGFQGYGSAGVLGTVLEMPSNFWRQTVQGENDRALWKSIADLVGIGTGLPTTAPMRAIEEALSDDVSPLEMILGADPVGR